MCQENEQAAHASDTEISPLVGWMATNSDGIHDLDIVEYCSRLGARNYNFMNYPVGGMKRSSWRPEKLVLLMCFFFIGTLDQKIWSNFSFCGQRKTKK